MQNVTLPDKDEVEGQMGFADTMPYGSLDKNFDPFRAVLREIHAPHEAIAIQRVEIAMLKAWLRALYAKHGEDCPLFDKEE